MEKMRKIRPYKLLMGAFALVWAVITLYPLFFTFMCSFKNNDQIYNTMFALPERFSFVNYKDALVRGNMLHAVINSFLFAAAATIVFLLCSIMASFVITRMKVKFGKYLQTLFAFGVMIPIYAALVPLAKIAATFHLSNNVYFVVLLFAAFQISISVFIITAYMREISPELDEAAIIDGCGPVRLLFQIIMPISTPAIATAGILGFLAVYNDLIFAVMFLTDKSLITISIGLMSFVGQFSSQLGPRFAAIIISVVPMIIVYMFLQDKVEQGITAGAVKG